MRGEDVVTVSVVLDLFEHVEDEVLSDAPLAGISGRLIANRAAEANVGPAGEGVVDEGAVVAPRGEGAELLSGAVASEVGHRLEELHRGGAEGTLSEVAKVG